jgi:hypothetical protein
MGQTAQVIELRERCGGPTKPKTHVLGRLAPDSLGGRLLARAFPRTVWCGSAIRELLEAEPSFGMNVVTQGPAYVHVLALAHLHPERLPGDVKLRARLLMAAGYRHIIEHTAQLPAGLMSVLRKLGSRALDRRTYELLVWAIQEPALRKVLCHCTWINGAQLRVLEALPQEYAGSRIVRRIRNGRELYFVISTVMSAEKMLGEASRQRIVASFAKVERPGQLLEWLERLTADVCFAEPPWPGTERLVPVRTGAELRAVGRSFKNCAEYHAEGAKNGRYSFYLWRDGRARALVMLERNAYLGWLIRELKGRGNHTVPAAQDLKIRLEFDDSGIVNARVYYDSFVHGSI